MAPKKTKPKYSSRTMKKTTVNAKNKLGNKKNTVKVGLIGKLYVSPTIEKYKYSENTPGKKAERKGRCGGKYKQKRCCDTTLSKKPYKYCGKDYRSYGCCSQASQGRLSSPVSKHGRLSSKQFLRPILYGANVIDSRVNTDILHGANVIKHHVLNANKGLHYAENVMIPSVTNPSKLSPKQLASIKSISHFVTPRPQIERNTNSSSSSSIETELSSGVVMTNLVYQCNHVPITITLNIKKKDLGYTLEEQRNNSKYGWIKSNVIVSKLAPKGLSEKSGLKVGDIILYINGKTIENIKQAHKEIATVKENVENIPINFNENGTGVTTSLLLIVYRDPEYSVHEEYLPYNSTISKM